MKKLFVFFTLLLTLTFIVNVPATSVKKEGKEGNNSQIEPITHTLSHPYELYTRLQLNKVGLDFSVFDMAVSGFGKLKNANTVSKNIIAICDFSQSSECNRFYVIDVARGKLLFNTLVAHGKNSGEEFARYFSNEPSSLKSSLGFFSTKETYSGKHGLSLKLNGLEPGINNNAEERAIVMHGADYVSPAFINENGRLGRSFGCPAVPYEQHRQIINTLKEGSCLFIYSPDRKYLHSSSLLNL